MKGGFLVAVDRGLFARASSVLVQLGGAQGIDERVGAVTQLADDEGRLFTLYRDVSQGTDWEVRQGPFIAAPGVQIPDMRTVTACPFECRWPDLVVRVAASVVGDADVSTWVLDGDGVVWDAKAVDLLDVRL